MEVPTSAPSAGAWEEPHWCQCRVRPLIKAQNSQEQLPRANPTACSHCGLGAAVGPVQGRLRCWAEHLFRVTLCSGPCKFIGCRLNTASTDECDLGRK